MSILEIILLVVTLFICISIGWSTFFVGIPPMPSSYKARKAMRECCAETGNGAIFELGSGWGNLLIPLAKQFPQRQLVGYELSLMPWFVTWVLIKLLGLKNITLYRKDFLQADLSGASVIVCYLFPESMKKLEGKLQTNGGKLEYIISNNFSLPQHRPVKTIQLTDLYQSPIYLYRF